MLLRRILVLSLLTASTTAMADNIDINLSNSTAMFQYNAAMGHGTQGKSEFHVGVLYNDVNSVLADVGILVANDENAAGLGIGVGVKGVIASANRNSAAARSNATALALGAQVRFSPPAVKQLAVVGELYLAPKIITFGDADRFSQISARVEYEILPQTSAYVGYRKTKFGIKAGGADAVIDNGGFVGVRMAF